MGRVWYTQFDFCDHGLCHARNHVRSGPVSCQSRIGALAEGLKRGEHLQVLIEPDPNE